MPKARPILAIAAAALATLAAFPAPSALAQQKESKNPVVVLETSCGTIAIELYPEKAPITVDNFLKYVDDGFYNNLLFHRVLPDFMIQGGGETDKMEEKAPTYPPIKNESGNGLKNERGAIAMARTSRPDSATCQFFINLKDNDRLDTLRYAVFGKVIEGMDTVDAIAKVARTTRAGTQEPSVPVEPIYIKSARRRKG
ncbi:Peptidyl-prolyl cis-trans isomerase A precursor [Aquisphaera giovannonii]|uniref:Peptidyl-prolyl cis-trans isomerase n=1 Tax=Aquisphaera giovannonii TaxID=406548 RepID=A0A5B9VY33_9BACT|nr:peptidylprolyl isomerase [Aquisphaera giovannonii]QEH33253.1 Peptidyl-prolyl cis-trans isomerase A precursor [Aquisphaera giovannonii]